MLRAWWQTTWGGLTNPRAVLQPPVAGAGLRGPALYVVAQGTVLMLPLIASIAALVVFRSAFVAPGEASRTNVSLLLALLAGWVVVPLLTLAATVVVSGLDHLVLRVAGVRGRWSTTFHGTAWGQAPLPLAIIPVCGFYVWGVWSVVVRYHALKAAHGCSKGAALAAAITAPLLCCGGWAANMVLVFTRDISR